MTPRSHSSLLSLLPTSEFFFFKGDRKSVNKKYTLEHDYTRTKKFKLKRFLRTPCGSAKIKKWRTSQWHELRSKKSGARPALSISSYRRAVDLHSFPVFANPVPAVFLNADQDPATKTS